MADDESKSPFELNPAKLRQMFSDDDALGPANRGELVSWFEDFGLATVFDKDGFTVTNPGSPPRKIKWGELAWHWKRGQDAVFTFLGVEVPVDTKAMAWEMLADLLEPGTSPPCALLLPLVAPVSPLWPSRFA